MRRPASARARVRGMIALALGLALTAVAGVQSATALGPSPVHVAIPYLGTLELSPAQGWFYTDCASSVAATPLLTTCDAENMVFTSTEYEHDADPVVVPVGMTDGAVTLVVEYFVSLEPPPAPAFQNTIIDAPVYAGATTLIPFSELLLDCLVCDAGVAVELVSIDPADQGIQAGIADMHLVIHAPESFRGTAQIQVRFRDDFGQWSTVSGVEVYVVPAPAQPIVALHTVVPMPTETDEIPLLQQVFAAGDTEPDEVTLLGCGRPMHGTLLCSPDGIAEYVPEQTDEAAGDAPPAPIDQFAYWVRSSDGVISSGSVTFTTGEVPAHGLASAARIPDPESEGVVTSIVPRVPVAQLPDGSTAGIFTPISRFLTEHGL